mgnify:FL=1
MVFEWYPTGFTGNKFSCDGYRRINKRGQAPTWQKVKDYDFTVVVFLNDYNNEVTFDERFEVRGGKLEFLTHDFGFNAERGTAVVFPCRPNFISSISPIEAGDLNLLRFHIIAKDEYQYDMDNFPGGYKEWFGEV